MKLTNKTVLLTGASGGIGQALARQLANNGARLVLMGRNLSTLERLRTDIPGKHQIIVADLTDTNSLSSAVHSLRLLMQPIDILINNAGISRFALLEQMTQEQISALVQTNLVSPMVFTQQVLPLLNPHGAQIVNIGSTFGTLGYPGYTGYCATKFGLRGFTESLARELADTNILVQYIAPRATKTSINSSSVTQMNGSLGNRMDTPEWVAKKICGAIKKRTRSLNLGWPEKLYLLINNIFRLPLDRAIHSQLATIKRFAQEQ